MLYLRLDWGLWAFGGQVPPLSITLHSPIRINVLNKDPIKQPDSYYVASLPSVGISGVSGLTSTQALGWAQGTQDFQTQALYFGYQIAGKSSTEQKSKCQETQDMMRMAIYCKGTSLKIIIVINEGPKKLRGVSAAEGLAPSSWSPLPMPRWHGPIHSFPNCWQTSPSSAAITTAHVLHSKDPEPAPVLQPL